MKVKNILTLLGFAAAAFFIASRQQMQQGGDELELITYDTLPAKRGTVGGLFGSNLQATAPING